MLGVYAFTKEDEEETTDFYDTAMWVSVKTGTSVVTPVPPSMRITKYGFEL
ncbi:MAG: hypothetical protein Pg6C_20780 [Treponemataceae bacterium]|nr:MAG: hypothetical protein Pg6C_20780 [Treponemataceae bacterium]